MQVGRNSGEKDQDQGKMRLSETSGSKKMRESGRIETRETEDEH